MQPSNSLGRKMRLAMMPISWAVAILVVYAVFAMMAAFISATIGELLYATSLWPLVVFLPAVLFGKILGLMALNLVAYSIPAVRRIFDWEVAQTGRHPFSRAMKDLSKIALVAGGATVIGACLFLSYR
jgi:hypothetical protein